MAPMDPPVEVRSLFRFPLSKEAAMPRRLAAVPENAPALRKQPPKKVTEAASDGSHRELLVAMRARVATAVEDPTTPARDLAALTRRLMEIAKEIAAMDARDGEEGVNAPVPDESFDASSI